MPNIAPRTTLGIANAHPNLLLCGLHVGSPCSQGEEQIKICRHFAALASR